MGAATYQPLPDLLEVRMFGDPQLDRWDGLHTSPSAAKWRSEGLR
jgi:hypothetical protein